MNRGARTAALYLLLASGAGLALRLYAATRVGFGDSEALYAAYALHPAPAYLDHPGLVGLFARAIGDGTAPSPLRAHRVTAALATCAPWALVLAARAIGARWTAALAAGLAVAVVPEIAVGLFAMTPDLLLFLAWTGAIGFAGAALLARPSSLRAAACFSLAGLLAGVAAAAKVSAVGLILALVLTYASRAARDHARTAWPWAGLGLGAMVTSPAIAFESAEGWPMLRHRLIDTQANAGVSLRNLGALLGGQLAYVSPVLLVIAVLVAHDLWGARRESAVAGLLARSLFVSLALLVPLCLWSEVAEPHWVAPALLAIPLWFAARDTSEPRAALRWGPLRDSPRLRRAGVVLGAVMSLAVHAWVLVPRLAAIVPQGSYDAKLDISNELYGWPEVADIVRELADGYRPGSPDPGDIVLIGPHWVISAQLAAALGEDFPVACAGSESADFAAWYPRRVWERADLLVFVTDDRFPTNTTALFPRRVQGPSRTVEVRRGGHVARTFRIEILRGRDVG